MAVAGVSQDLKILLVDDFEVMRRILRSSLKREGFSNFIEASGAEEALQTLSTESVDLVIADWHMPDMPGLDLLEAIRGDEKLAKIPFLMVATKDDVEHAPASLNTVKSACVAKPFSSEDLAKKIKKICKTRKKKAATKTTKAAAKKSTSKTAVKKASNKTTTKKAESSTKSAATKKKTRKTKSKATSKASSKKASASTKKTKASSKKKAGTKKSAAKKTASKKS